MHVITTIRPTNMGNQMVSNSKKFTSLQEVPEDLSAEADLGEGLRGPSPPFFLVFSKCFTILL